MAEAGFTNAGLGIRCDDRRCRHCKTNAAADGKGPFPEKQKPVWTSAIAGRRANGNIPGGSNNKMELSEFEFQPWCFNKVDANRN